MKALTLYEPWATLMRLGEKNIETRSWPTTHRGLLAIHAAKTMPPFAHEFLQTNDVIAAFFRAETQPVFRPGVILCVRELIACVPTTEVKNISQKELRFGDYRPGRFAWIFSPEIKVISPPIAVRGNRRLWNWEQ